MSEGRVLGFPLLCLQGMRIITFQLPGFYLKRLSMPSMVLTIPSATCFLGPGTLKEGKLQTKQGPVCCVLVFAASGDYTMEGGKLITA